MPTVPSSGDEVLADLKIKERLTLVAQENAEDDFLATTFGLAEPAFAELVKIAGGRHASLRDARGRVSRFKLEEFLAREKLLTPRQAAYRLGMTIASLDAAVGYALNESWVIPGLFGVSGVVYRKEIIDHLHRHFPPLARKVFANHSNYVRALHAAFAEAGVTVEPVPDVVATLLGEGDLAADIDVVTAGGVGLRYAVWMDFGKPFFLEPDKTSMLTFIRFEKELRRFIPAHTQVDEGLLEKVRQAAGR
jgi:hypothetical protein